MFNIAFLYTKQCLTMHFYIQNNVLQCISIQKTIFYYGFLSIKECFTMHANLLKNVLQCISIYKTNVLRCIII